MVVLMGRDSWWPRGLSRKLVLITFSQALPLRGVLRLYLKPDVSEAEQRFGDLILDLATRPSNTSWADNWLTMKNLNSKYLMEHPREVLSFEQILKCLNFMGESNVISVRPAIYASKSKHEEQKQLIQNSCGCGICIKGGLREARRQEVRGKQEEAILRGIKLRCYLPWSS